MIINKLCFIICLILIVSRAIGNTQEENFFSSHISFNKAFEKLKLNESPEFDQPTLYVINCEYTGSDIVLTASYHPAHGTRSTVECTLGKGVYGPVPQLAKFVVHVVSDKRAVTHQVPVSHYFVDKEYKMIRPTVYDFSFPVDIARKIDPYTPLLLVMPRKFLSHATGGKFCILIQFEEVLYFSEKKSSERRSVISTPIRFEINASGELQLGRPTIILLSELTEWIKGGRIVREWRGGREASEKLIDYVLPDESEPPKK